MFRPLVFTLVSVLLVTSCYSARSGGTSESGNHRRPNVLLIVADDLGYSDLGCYGGEIGTPVLDSLAAGGARLRRFYTTPRCCPSRAAILTGQYSHRVGLGHMVKDIGQPGYRGRLADSAVTLGELLTVSGYRSFISGKWHVGTKDPTRHGFEEFYGTLVSAKTFWDPEHYLRLPGGRQARRYDGDEFYATDALTDHALDFLGKARGTPDRPWFLYLAFNAPHFPLQAPPGDIEKYAGRYSDGWDLQRERRIEKMRMLGIVPRSTRLPPRSRYWTWAASEGQATPAWETLAEDRRADLARRMAIYAAMVDRMDRNIGRVVEDLTKEGELENTVIVFISDNGACAEWDPFGFDGRSGPRNVLWRGAELERMGDSGTFHSVGSGWAGVSNAPWQLYKHFAHEGGIASPCIVHWPAGLDARGAIVDGAAHAIDLVPTILAAAGLAYPREHEGHETLPLPGRSLLPLLRGEPVAPRALFFEHEGHRAVHAGRWKLVARSGQPWELYDVTADRTELHDLASSEPDRVQELEREWMRWAREQLVMPFPSSYQVEYLPE